MTRYTLADIDHIPIDRKASRFLLIYPVGRLQAGTIVTARDRQMVDLVLAALVGAGLDPAWQHYDEQPMAPFRGPNGWGEEA